MSFGLERPAELDPVTAAELDQLVVSIRAQIESEHDDDGRHLPFQDYAPEWSAGSEAPSLGIGTVRGRWARRGTEILFRMELVIGDTTTTGVGAWGFTLPVRPKERGNVFVATFEDVSADSEPPGSAKNPERGNNAAGTLIRVRSAAGAAVTSAVPFTWASGDVLRIQGTYEGVAE